MFRLKLLSHLGVVCLLLVLGAWARADAPLLQLQEQGQNSVVLTGYFELLEDTSAKMSLADIRAADEAGQFTPSNSNAESLIYGFTPSAYWLKLQVYNPGENPLERLLEISYARLSEISLYQFEGEALVKSWQTGTNYPFASRPYANRAFVFPLQIPAHGHQIIYLRAEGVAALEIPAKLWEPSAFHAYERDDYLGFSVYSGMALAMVIFNTLVFLLLRESMYLLYVMFVSCFAVTLAAQNGLANEFLWPNSPVWSKYSLAVGYSYTLVALLLFTRRMLNTGQLLPRIDKIIFYLAMVFLCSPLGFFSAYQQVVPFAVVLNVVASSLILGIGIYCALQRQRSAYFFVAAFLVICTASPVNSLRFAGYLPTNWFTVNGLQFGSAIEMMLLAYALADRLNMTRREKEAAQNAMLEAQRQLVVNLQDSERRLEQEVELRTQELVEKNHALEQLSITDPLTGIFNRIKLHEVLEQETERGRRYGTPLSLLIIDVDFFKSINDTYGHPVGDKVLREITQLLQRHCRSSDTLGRWGGEEFLVICPETSLEGALSFGELLRTKIADCHFSTRIAATISIGVAQIETDHSVDALLETADSALYEAKNSGRNCVKGRAA